MLYIHTFYLLTLRYKVETFQNLVPLVPTFTSTHIQFEDHIGFKIKYWFQPLQISYTVTKTVDQCLFLTFVPKSNFEFSLRVEQNKKVQYQLFHLPLCTCKAYRKKDLSTLLKL